MRWIIVVILLFSLYTCNSEKTPGNTIIFHIKWANNKKFYLHRIPFKDEKSIIIDSAIAKGDLDSLTFTIPNGNEQLFKVMAPEVDMEILFATDAPLIHIYANYGNTALYSFAGSPSSTGLHQFMLRQDSIVALGAKIAAQTDSAQKANAPKAIIDSLHLAFNKNLAYSFDQYKNFEDTVKSPAAFMALYNNVDFGNNYTGLKKFIRKSADRFPSFAPIQRLKENVLDMVKIYEEEYNVGDTLPSIELPNQYNLLFSTASLKGKYYLIDFWSTWCPQCMAYNEGKKALFKKHSQKDFELVSVAIDAEKENWKQMIEQQQLYWTQLIDEKMWNGSAVKTLKFDSIPFNFLVSPQGKIIAKAIKPDSLEMIVSEKIKKP